MGLVKHHCDCEDFMLDQVASGSSTSHFKEPLINSYPSASKWGENGDGLQCRAACLE